MAKAKKKETLTPEERLQAALVPDWEQPYKVPENWCWVKVGTVSNIKGGKRLPKGKSLLNEKSNYPYIRVTDFDNESVCIETVKYIDADTYSEIKNYTISSTDIYISIAGTIGKIGIIPKELEGANLTENAAKITNISGVYQLYLMFFLKSEFAQNQIRSSTISTTQPKLALFRIEDIALPLPPLLEQQRIVDRIESLFAKLDKAKQRAQDALDSFETRKAAILHKAFTGELTAGWRKEHGVKMENWVNSTVGHVCHEIKVGIVIKPSQYYTDEKQGTPAFRSANVRENHVDDFDWVYLNRAGMEDNSRSIVHTGDVLVVRSGNPGTACIVSEKFDGYNAIDILIAVPNHDKVSSAFLCAYTNSPSAKNLIFESKRGMALAHFNVKGYSGLSIRVPQLEEQDEIIRILDGLLDKEQQAKEAAEAVLKQIDLIKKSILARAFRGELGTNDPTEESTVELVKRINQGKVKSST